MMMRTIVLGLAVAGVGCGGDKAKTSDGTTRECAVVVPAGIDRIMKDKAGDPGVIELAPKVKEAMVTRCAVDTWSQAALYCIDKAATREAMDNCREHMTKDQQKQVQDAVRAVQPAPVPAIPPAPPPADGSGAGSAGSAGSAAPAEAGSGH